MASPVVFDCFGLDLGKGIHNFSVDDLYLYLTNSTPNKATNKVLSDLPSLATGGGYISGGVSIGPVSWSQAGGVSSLVPGSDALFTATTGFGPFRYAAIYNFTSPTKPLIAYYDNGVSISTPAGLYFLVDLASSIFNLGFS